ncbi:MAG: tetratricopeptide repeat protein [candidate division WOR-3 bacterium]|nr:tetratricopeptide repeat protein [candidate division WOR-3 bacterium]
MNLEKRTKVIILLVGVATLTFIFLSPCLQNGYCNWDDYHLITANHSIKELSWKNIKEMFSTGYVGTYIPLTVLSFAIENKLFKLNPFITHLINLILHIFNTILVFYLIYLLTHNFIIATIVSLLFGIHPLHVESVAWATERKDVLYSFFFLSSLILYYSYRKIEKRIYYFFSILSFIFAILSKPMAVSLPLVLILLDYYHDRQFSLKLVYSKIVYFIPAIVIGIINIHFQGSGSLSLVTYLKHIFVFFYNLLFYLFKLIIPVKLSAFYPYPESFEKSLPLIFIISPFIVAVIVYLVVLTGKYTQRVIFGALFFLITLLPVSQIVPLIAPAIAADRYTYIPSLGLFFIFGIFVNWMYNEKLKDSITLRRIFSFVLVLIFLIYGLISYSRCKVWRDSITLWTDVLEKYPQNGIAFNNRGNAYKLIGQYEKAIEDFNKAIEFAPELELPYFNRGTVYERLGQYDKAIADFTMALNLQPNFAVGYVDRGAVYCRLGEYDKAYNDLIRALQLNPNFAEAYYNLGVLYFNLKNYTLAMENYDRAIALDPYLSVAYLSKGDIFVMYGEYEKAIEYYTMVLRMDSLNFDAYYNRAVVFTRIGNLEQALLDYNQAIRFNPNLVHAYNNRGNIYLDIDEVEKAIADYNRAIELDPSYAPAYYNRAVAYYTMGEYDKALRDIDVLKKLGVIPDSNFLRLLERKK